MHQEFEEWDGVTVMECTGLLTLLKSLSFRFVLRTLLKVFNSIELVNRILQHRDNGLATALPVLRAAYSSLQGYRTDSAYEAILKDSKDLLPDEDTSFNTQ